MSTEIYKGQIYRCVGSEPYIRRRNGSVMELKLWESECTDCGQLFVFKSPSRYSTFKPSRRCEEHKKPRLRVRRVA